MKLIEYEAFLVNGSITIPLEKSCRCYIGLVELAIPNFNGKDKHGKYVIDITCDQIDSTFENPDRLLRRVPYKKFYKLFGTDPVTWTTQHIKMEKVDSNDKFLTLNFKQSDECVTFGTDKRVLLTLAVSE